MIPAFRAREANLLNFNTIILVLAFSMQHFVTAFYRIVYDKITLLLLLVYSFLRGSTEQRMDGGGDTQHIL